MKESTNEERLNSKLKKQLTKGSKVRYYIKETKNDKNHDSILMKHTRK